uniref:Cytochrome P450 n=1 Tax=Leersia perrieri TaxID=77586 RepID=A0A0D9X3I9_9ORYZ
MAPGHTLYCSSSSLPLTFLLAAAAAAVFLLLQRYIFRRPETPRGHVPRLPPSPPRLPIIGHLHLIGFLPHINLRDLAAKHAAGDYMLLHLGAMPTLVVSSPRAAEAVLRTHDHAFASRPPYSVTDALFSGTPDIAMAVYGEQWRQSRKLLTAHMLTVKKVSSYRHGREDEVRNAIAKLRRSAASDAVVDMSELLYSFTTGIMYRAVAGEPSDDGRNMRIRELLDATVNLVGGFYPESFFPWLGVLRRVTCARAEKVKRRWDELFDAVIDDAGKPSAARRHDPEGFVRILLSLQHEHGLPREHIKGMLINVFFGGTDTSYMVLEFMMAELMSNPQAMNKLQVELRSGIPGKREAKEVVTEDDLSDMIYLRAVIKETLRLHPPAPLLEPHLSMEKLEIDGYIIPANISVIVNAWAIGRDETVWGKDAEEFKPERFIDSKVSFKGNDFELLPFSAGRRICPGVNFAVASLEIMLANLMYHFDWELPVGIESSGIDMTEVFSSTLHRKEKLLLVPKIRGNNPIVGQ